MDIDKFPGALTIIGGLLALGGVFLYQKAELKREEMEKDKINKVLDVETAEAKEGTGKSDAKLEPEEKVIRADFFPEVADIKL